MCTLKTSRGSVCLITGGLTARNRPLQPWRYLHEVGKQLIRQEWRVTIVSDGAAQPGEQLLDGVPIHYLPTVSDLRWRPNQPLHDLLNSIAPDIVLTHVGLTSFLHQRLAGWQRAPSIGLFSSPLYSAADFGRLGYRKVVQGRQLCGVHFLNTMIPKPLVRRQMAQARMDCLVTQSETVRQQLEQAALWPRTARSIGPGVDTEWRNQWINGGLSTRERLGFQAADTVILYYGSPAALRGLHTLIRAFEAVAANNASLQLFILSRRREDELVQADAELKALLQQSRVRKQIHVVSGYLAPQELVDHVAAADIVALPFEIVPSDAPLTLLEAQALGKPVVTTNLACLPELVAHGRYYLAQPSSVQSLADALRQAAAEAQMSTATRPNAQAIRSWERVGAEWSELLCSYVS